MNILLFKIPLLGRIIRNIVVKKEGGTKESLSLREWCNKKHNVDIDLYTYGSCFSGDFNTGGAVSIGRYCSFGPNIHYYGANHPMNMAVMSPYFYNRRFSGFNVKDVDREHLSIGNDVWVGANVIILSKCHEIGNGAVIGAGTIVTDDVPAYSIVVGNPGHVIKYRFDKETIETLENSKWWECSPTELLKAYDYMSDPIQFAQVVEGMK